MLRLHVIIPLAVEASAGNTESRNNFKVERRVWTHNLQGASLIDCDDGGCSYAARTVCKRRPASDVVEPVAVSEWE